MVPRIRKITQKPETWVVGLGAVPKPQRRREELALLRAAKTNSDGMLNRLYERVEQGLASPSDRDFAGRLTHHRQRIAALTADIVSLERNWPPASAALRLT